MDSDFVDTSDIDEREIQRSIRSEYWQNTRSKSNAATNTNRQPSGEPPRKRPKIVCDTTSVCLSNHACPDDMTDNNVSRSNVEGSQDPLLLQSPSEKYLTRLISCDSSPILNTRNALGSLTAYEGDSSLSRKSRQVTAMNSSGIVRPRLPIYSDISSSSSPTLDPFVDDPQLSTTPPSRISPSALFSSPVRSSTLAVDMEAQSTPLKVSQLAHNLSSPLPPPLFSPPVGGSAVSNISPSSLRKSCIPGSSRSSPPLSHAHSVVAPDPGLEVDSRIVARYALRTRQAKQLNPYAYDKILYKQQMQSHPDAIVKIQSARGRHNYYDDELGGGAGDEEWNDRELGTGDEESRSQNLLEQRRDESQEANDTRNTLEDPFLRSYPDFLARQLSSDEEDDADIRETRLAARKARKEKNKKNKLDKKPVVGYATDAISFPLPGPSIPKRTAQVVNTSFTQDTPPPTSADGNGIEFLEIDDERWSPMSPSDDLANHTDVSVEEDDTYHAEDMTTGDRKRLRVLKRMMPAAMVKRQLQRSQPIRRDRFAAMAHSDSSQEDGPLQPGRTRTRLVGRTSEQNFDITGDPESSSSEPPTSRERTALSSLSSNAEAAHPSKSYRHRSSPEVIEISNSSDNATDIDDSEISAWINDRKHSTRHGAQTRKEESLIDWMLSGTRTLSSRCPGDKPKKHMHRNRSRRWTVLSRGAKKIGPGQQALLPFRKVKEPSHQSVMPEAPVHNMIDNGVDPPEYVPMAAKAKGVSSHIARMRKRAREQVPAGLYVFHSNNTIITSGRNTHPPRKNHRRRRMNQVISVDVADEEFHQALAPTLSMTLAFDDNRRLPRFARISKGHHVHPAPNSLPNLIHQVAPENPQHEEYEHKIQLDLNIRFLPSGISFPKESYLGKGWLHELVTLVSGKEVPVRPNAYNSNGLNFDPSAGVKQFTTSLAMLCDHLAGAAYCPDDLITQQLSTWDVPMHSACQLVSWLASSVDEDQRSVLQAGVMEEALRLITLVDSSSSSSDNPIHGMTFTVFWFAIELSARLASGLQNKGAPPDTNTLVKYIFYLMRRLRGYGLQETLQFVQDYRQGLDTKVTPQRVAELWICVLHLLNNCDILLSGNQGGVHPFWKIVHQLLETGEVTIRSGLEASEEVWRILFSLCALSQFSVHGMSTSMCRLPASWGLVVFALKQIRLTAEPGDDENLSKRSLDKRDEYIWLISSRCFMLWSRWHWRLDDAHAMINQLVEIFKSRKFGNLRHETSDFPKFMRDHDIRLLSQYDSNDTAFELFLKIVVQAATDEHSEVTVKSVSPKVKKLLSLAIPVGSVAFTKSTPPSMHDLSMLYNRLGAIAVAVHLEPSPVNVRFRMAHARRFVRFEDADEKTRIACIRGMMYFAILLQHHGLPLDEALGWLGEMTTVLLTEYVQIELKPGSVLPENPAKSRLVFCIQVLLGSVKVIIETPSMNYHLTQRVDYPDPALLEGPWISRILSATTDLGNVFSTGLQIRLLVQAFLDARNAVMPKPAPSQPPANNQDSQETQDEYGAFNLDLDDPELRAAPGDEIETPSMKVRKSKDERLCHVIDKSISPAIYRLVCRYLKNSLPTDSSEAYCLDADKWIECWVGCANVVVQNGKRDWSLYLTLGSQSWEKIIDPSWRRRVGLKFMFTVLTLDPPAYFLYQDRFMEVLVESLVCSSVTLENKYTDKLFSIDGFRHLLLHNIPYQSGTETSELTKAEFLVLRITIIQTIFSNLAYSLKQERLDESLRGPNQTCIGYVVTLFSAMKDTCGMISTSEQRARYSGFCSQILEFLSCHEELRTHTRLVDWVAWAKSLNDG